MRIIYIFRRDDFNNRFYTRNSGWLTSDKWYTAGKIFGYILQFIAGVGIGWTVTTLLKLIGLI